MLHVTEGVQIGRVAAMQGSALVMAVLVGCGSSQIARESVASAETLETHRFFKLVDSEEAAAALAEVIRSPFAARPREGLVEIYRHHGFDSVAAFFEAGIISLESRTVSRGQKLVGQAWVCPSDRVRESSVEVRELLMSRPLAEVQAWALDLYEKSGGACEAAMLWAWCELQKDPRMSTLSDRETAVRTILTGIEDGLPWLETMRPETHFEVYEDVAFHLAALGDELGAAVAAKRAEGWLDGVPGQREMIGGERLQQLEYLQERVRAKLVD